MRAMFSLFLAFRNSNSANCKIIHSYQDIGIPCSIEIVFLSNRAVWLQKIQ